MREYIDSIMSERQRYLERFTRFEYPNAFSECKEKCRPLFEGLSDGETTVKAVEALLEYAAEQTSAPFFRGLRLDGLQRFIALYLVPAAIDSGEDGKRFAQTLCQRWNEAYPKHPFSCGTYEELAAGFRTKPFGL